MQRDHLKGLISLSYPVYFELLAGVIAGILSTFWVAKLGGEAVAAVTIATNFENVLLALILMASAGTTVLISRHMGANDLSAVKSVIKSSWILAAIIGILVAGIGFLFRSDIAGLFIEKGESSTLALTVSFFAISFPGILVFYAQNISDSIFKGNRNTKFPMRMALLANLLILILDPLFIYGLVGLPEMGVQGAALATVLARTITLVVALMCLYRSEIMQKCKEVAHGSTVGAAIKQILNIGLPMSGDFFARMLSSMLMIGLIGSFGVASLAAYGIGTKIIVFVTMFFYAVRQAGSIITSHKVGAGQNGDIPSIGRQSLVLGCGAAAVAAVLMYAIAPLLVQIFTDTDQIVQQGSVYLHFMSFFLIPLGCAVSIGGVLLGSGQSRVLLYTTLLGSLINLVLAYWFSSFDALQLNGVWIAQIVGVVLQALVLLYVFGKGNARLKSVQTKTLQG